MTNKVKTLSVLISLTSLITYVFRLSRNFTVNTQIGGSEREGLYQKNIQSSTSFYNNHSRNLSTQGIEGASPSKFRHKNRKLFVDRKEIMTAFGGQPGQYHGFENDKPVGGTYKATESPFWNEKGKLDKKIVAGARLNKPRDFQAKRKIPEINSTSFLNMPSASSIADQTKGYIKPSPELKTRLLQQKVMRDLGKLKREESLPYLRESVSNPGLSQLIESPYKASRNTGKRSTIEMNRSGTFDKLPKSINYSREHPYIMGALNNSSASFRPSLVYANK